MILILALLISSGPALGGQEVGNGGMTVECRLGHARPSKEKTEVELLDLVEDRMLRKGRHHHSKPPTNPRDLALERLRLLERFAPDYAAKLGTRASVFLDEVDFLPKTRLTGSEDSLHLALPAGCQLRQAAIRRKAPFQGERRFVVDQSVWEKMSRDHQAALILHEVIYEGLALDGATDSRQARAINAILMREDFQSWSAQRFFKEISPLDQLATEIQIGELRFKVGGGATLELYPDGKPRRGTLAAATAKFKIQGNDIELANPSGPIVLEFYSTGVPVKGWIRGGRVQLEINKRQMELVDVLEFHPSGAVKRGFVQSIDGKRVGSDEAPVPMEWDATGTALRPDSGPAREKTGR